MGNPEGSQYRERQSAPTGEGDLGSVALAVCGVWVASLHSLPFPGRVAEVELVSGPLR